MRAAALHAHLKLGNLVDELVAMLLPFLLRHADACASTVSLLTHAVAETVGAHVAVLLLELDAALLLLALRSERQPALSHALAHRGAKLPAHLDLLLLFPCGDEVFLHVAQPAVRRDAHLDAWHVVDDAMLVRRRLR
jgi:hypothetical protein